MKTLAELSTPVGDYTVNVSYHFGYFDGEVIITEILPLFDDEEADTRQDIFDYIRDNKEYCKEQLYDQI